MNLYCHKFLYQALDIEVMFQECFIKFHKLISELLKQHSNPVLNYKKDIRELFHLNKEARRSFSV